MQCEKYQDLREQQKRLQEDAQRLREAIAAPDEPIEDWVKQGHADGDYDEIVDIEAAVIAVAFERTQGVPDDDGQLSVAVRENRKAQRQLKEGDRTTFA